jgi:hypothetical protein
MDTYALTVPCVENHIKERWISIEEAREHPVEEFWPKIFPVLSDTDEKLESSTKGLESAVFPFGTRHRICPGRQLSTRAILCLAATFITAFDFEPTGQDGWASGSMDPKTFGYTPSRPSTIVLALTDSSVRICGSARRPESGCLGKCIVVVVWDGCVCRKGARDCSAPMGDFYSHPISGCRWHRALARQ